MNFYMLLDFVGTLRETQKLFFRNVKLMSCIILLIISLSSALFLSTMLSIKPLITDLSLKVTLLPTISPTSPEFANLILGFKDDLRLIAALEWIFISAFCFASLLFATASILASGVAYRREDLSAKELLSRAVKSLKRPLVTWFYITLLHLGYSLFLVVFLFPFALDSTFTTPAFSTVIFLVALVFQAHLAVVWNLALVVSVLEEKCGIEALGKAGQLIKGSKLRGFFLNLFFEAFSLFLWYCLHKVGTTARSANAVMIPLLILIPISCLIRMFVLMTYTVLYYECKEGHGEELEMQGSAEFTKVAFSPLISADVP